MHTSDRSQATYGNNTSTYNLTFSPGNYEKQQGNNSQTAVMGYLNEKIKYLEIENNELKKEVLMKVGDKERIDYFLRLRKDMMEEIEKLKGEKVFVEMKFSNEIQKLNEEIGSLNKKLLQKDKDKLINVNIGNSKITKLEQEELFTTERTARLGNDLIPNKNEVNAKSSLQIGFNTSKYFQNLVENEVASNFSDDNFFLNPSVLNNSMKDVYKGENPLLQSTVPYIGLQLEDIARDSATFMSNNQNPYFPVIYDLEDRIKMLENVVKDKDQEISNLEKQQVIVKNETDKEFESLKRELDLWKQKYTQVLSNKKSLSNEYEEMYDKQSENYRTITDKTIYELEKKILHLEKINEKYEKDIEKLSKMNSDSENVKQSEIESLKTNMKILIGQYEHLYENYEDNIKILTKQIDSVKQLYHARENEFINITNYYTETINDYAKPILETNANSNFKQLEDQYVQQTKEVEELRKKVESYIRELTNSRMDSNELRPKIRQKITEAMINYDENIKNIVDTHNTLEQKLEKILDFMNNFDEKFVFFNTLIEDNKKLDEKISSLECQLKMFDNDDKDKEICSLKEQNLKLLKDFEIKNNLIKEYEDALSRYESIAMSKNKKTKESPVTAEIVNKLKNEILVLSAQTVNLNKTKEGIERFYQAELKNLLEKVNQRNDKIEELRGIIRKMENDYAGKKETTFNLWMLEFKEFKQNLITISDIKLLIDKFQAEGQELTVHKDKVYNEELYLLRQEIQIKDDLFKNMKENFENDRKNLQELINGYKSTTDTKIILYEKLFEIKKAEINALKNEKKNLDEIESSKKKVNYFNFIFRLLKMKSICGVNKENSSEISSKNTTKLKTKKFICLKLISIFYKRNLKPVEN
jgi:hypothetical protein